MHLEHEQRNVRNYPSDFKPGYNAQPSSRYYYIGPDGNAYLDLDKIGKDLDTGSPDCNCGPGCNCQPAGNVGGADPYTEAISVGLKGLGDFAQAFKKGEKAQELSQKLKAIKAQCPKKPFIRISKKQKAQYQSHLDCIAQVAQREQELEREALRAGQAMAAAPADKEDNTGLYIGIAAGAFILILIIVMIILFMRSKAAATKTKK